ncbi:MAG TPA: DUF5666 domain-containing protein [Candidatus Acidoferrum sp.]|nr:DUF5666 domain-containing protein [Candidatus Acidoferrum sp.]
MKLKTGFFWSSLVLLFAGTLAAPSAPRQAQEQPPAQQSGATQNPDGARARGQEGFRRPGVFGKLTAIHDQSLEITNVDGEVVTVKISADTRYRKDRDDAKLSDFKVGDLVFVRGQENPDHTWNAELIGQRSGGFSGRGPGAGGRGGGPGIMRSMGTLGKDYVLGEVKAVDAPNLTILRPDNATQTVVLTEDTSMRKGRDSITMADIQPGDHVFVRGETKDDVFQPRTVIVIGPEQWKRMQEMGMGGPGGAPPNGQQKPPEQPN